jgi:hypothetical protein
MTDERVEITRTGMPKWGSLKLGVPRIFVASHASTRRPDCPPALAIVRSAFTTSLPATGLVRADASVT